MTDPDLQALAEPMFDALMDRKPLDRRAQAEICAQAAADFFAARLERADRIETAARRLIDTYQCITIEQYGEGCECASCALRAALEGP